MTKTVTKTKILLEKITAIYYTTNNIPTAPLSKDMRNPVGFLF